MCGTILLTGFGTSFSYPKPTQSQYFPWNEGPSSWLVPLLNSHKVSSSAFFSFPILHPHYLSLFHSSPPFKITQCILIVYMKIFLWPFSSPCLISYLEKEMATHSSILVWRIPWTEEPSGLQSMGLRRVGQDWMTNTFAFTPGDQA